MMFELDNQTIKDLDIFGNSSNQNSVFDYFNHTHTKGGQDALSQMMRSPINDINILTFRKDAIQYFGDNKVAIQFNSSQFDFIEHYLKLNIPVLKDNYMDAYSAHLSNLLKAKNDYHIISKGIEYLIDVLRTQSIFFQTLDLTKMPSEMSNRISSLSELLEDKLMKSALSNKAKLSPRSINKFDQIFRSKLKNSVRDFLDLLYLFDALGSVSKVYINNGLCLPEYTDSKTPTVAINGLYHPLVKNAIKNDVILDESQNLFFLTGPNMAGKSTFLKSIGLSIHLSHLGFPINADKMKTSIYNGLVSTINLSDDISRGYSHFYSEVKRVKETAIKIKTHGRVFVLCDELFRGTNVKDAFEGSTLIISALSKIKNCTFFISTHITEVAVELKNSKNIQFKYLDAKLVNNTPEFTYKLCPGISEVRLGLYILKNEKITDILDEAYQISADENH
ncbi:MAG: hypothetical protein GQ574_07325 [Crocinitomix sp.]|nr:hypothetical protein [Crocinitomix sp.]